eukprot:TRINITY_DN74298_c0_g1_i2.p1 TRINITY_DN74298_c0_g1~~TRINITY_DN74298_c0_g1_i2.p1  ORF type:complete len:423 (-),score=98.05 TRINITY_DN74298_c0_g1_i2:34-1302(-)
MHEDSTNSYLIKDIKFFGSPRRILLQSANGPCPLLAICNILLLRNQIRIPSDSRYVSFAELVEIVSNFLFDANAAATSGGSETTSSRDANLQENINSSLEILPRLNVGLDVNCRFSGPTEFEYTSELAVFDLLDICLYHGWVVSEQDQKAYKTFGHLTYNQIVERLIAFDEAQQRIVAASAAEAGADGGEVAAEGDAAAEEKIIEDGLLIKDFMDRTASQLSFEGLLALHDIVRERQLVVFFRNSHFSTLLKYSGELYLLCTDIAFSTSHVLWERLDQVDGDTSYCDADFQANTAHSEEAAAQAAAEAAQETAWTAAIAGEGGGGGHGSLQEQSDALLARQLMEQDLQDAQQQRLAQQQQPPAVQGQVVGVNAAAGEGEVPHGADVIKGRDWQTKLYERGQKKWKGVFRAVICEEARRQRCR